MKCLYCNEEITEKKTLTPIGEIIRHKCKIKGMVVFKEQPKFKPRELR